MGKNTIIAADDRRGCLQRGKDHLTTFASTTAEAMGAVGHVEDQMGVKKTGKGRRKLGQKKRRMRARIRHRKG